MLTKVEEKITYQFKSGSMVVSVPADQQNESIRQAIIFLESLLEMRGLPLL